VKKQRAGAAQAVLEALQALHTDQSTTAFRAAGQAVVALRQLYTVDGRTDWTGRSVEYRDAIEGLYRQADLPPDSESPVQSKVRYHVGNVLREVAPAEELEALGLATAGPKGRAQANRAAGGRRRRAPAEVTRTRIDSPLTVAALGLDALKMLQVMDIQDEDKDIVDDLVRKMLDEAVEYLRGS
jgi:hypothetical protein